MPEVLAQFAEAVVGDGIRYRAQACGAPMHDGLWEGWIEFVPLDGGTPIRSRRETTQPNRADVVYWAGGLTAIYLEGALDRALKPLVHETTAPAHPVFDGPALDLTSVEVPPPGRQAVLNPFAIYEKSEVLLRQELGALSSWHLVNIAVAYRLSGQPTAVLNQLPGAALIDLIVRGVRERASVR